MNPSDLAPKLVPASVLVAMLLCPSLAPAASLVEVWRQRYDGPQNSYEQANALAVDGAGNVCVTGNSIGGPGTLDYDYATIKYSSTGTPLWTNRYNGPGNSQDGAVALALDTKGNVFVTGYSIGSGTSYFDYATVAYSAAGRPLWTNRYNGPGNGADYPKAIAVDSSGNVFVTGNATGSAGNYDFVTIKYSNAGVPLWTNRYDGPGNRDDRPAAMVLDASGNVFVTGYSTGTALRADYTTIKYSNAGVPLWTNRYNGPDNGEDRATAIGLDANGNVFVTGYSTNNASGLDCLTIAYSNAGLPLWTNRYDGPNHGDDWGQALAVDLQGNVLVTGGSAINSGPYDDYVTIKYSNAGVPLWTNRYDYAGGEDLATAIAADARGNVFVSGYSDTFWSMYAYSYSTLVYSPEGVLLWTAVSGVDGEANAMALDGNGDVLVTGYSEPPYEDFVTIKYSVPQPEPLFLQKLTNQVVLTWTNTAFALQAAPAPTGTFITIPNAASPYTNTSMNGRQFFRLISK